MNTVTIEQALEALDSLDSFARMDLGVDAQGPRETLRKYIEQTRPQVMGPLTPCAPWPGMEEPWPEEKIIELQNALKSVLTGVTL